MNARGERWWDLRYGCWQTRSWIAHVLDCSGRVYGIMFMRDGLESVVVKLLGLLIYARMAW
jgi:hypothetical protein